MTRVLVVASGKGVAGKDRGRPRSRTGTGRPKCCGGRLRRGPPLPGSSDGGGAWRHLRPDQCRAGRHQAVTSPHPQHAPGYAKATLASQTRAEDLLTAEEVAI